MRPKVLSWDWMLGAAEARLMVVTDDVGTGQLALSAYVGHLLLLDTSAWLVRRETVPDAFFAVGVFFLVVACICVLWRATLPRGPLEAALAGPWWIVERGLRHLDRDSMGTPGTVP